MPYAQRDGLQLYYEQRPSAPTQVADHRIGDNGRACVALIVRDEMRSHFALRATTDICSQRRTR